MKDFTIRTARPEDAAALLSIYTPYVERTAVSFEYAAPTEAEFRRRICTTLERYPYLVAEEPSGTVVGYAYAGPFQSRTAYQWSCEGSIYLSPAAQGKGLGRRLYAALEEALRSMGVRNLYACIAVPADGPDEFLNDNSQRFHAHLGFETVGHFHRCGQKFGRWYDMVWMEKVLEQHPKNCPPIVPFPEL